MQRYHRKLLYGLIITSTIVTFSSTEAQSIDSLKRVYEELSHRLDIVEKVMDDVLWFQRVGDIAYIDKILIVGPPPSKVLDSNARGAKNPLKFWSYVFIPRSIDKTKKYPLLVIPHGGVHANFTTYHAHIIRECMAQGYIVVAPEYRGSTGYGKSFYEYIDYGGREVEDVHETRNWMVVNCPYVDSTRIGLVGWSHGAMIAFLAATRYPNAYQVVFAGVPVSDLIMRIQYRGREYQEYFSAPYHIGKTLEEDTLEYYIRSPVAHASKLQTPLRIHTNTNDDDVYVEEVLHLIDALKKAGKHFEYEIFENEPGGHSFDRIDTRRAKEIRLKIYHFLQRYLQPPYPFRTLQDLERAGYW
ncbi:MAG: prolyl oligopeptidase family serine peptidase [Bacteroidetes bacterium]|nr:prolyl oligopeptidase family serine peptidase [Bacteroidota bacterium]